MLLSTIFEIYRGSQRRKPEYLEKNNNIGFDFWCFNATFSNMMATSFSGGRSRSSRREPPTMCKQLVNWVLFICNLQSRAWTHAVLAIGLYELLGNPTT